MIKGEAVTIESLAEIDPEDYPTRRFPPNGAQVGGALGLILLGFGVTYAISRFGAAKPEAKQ